jgi:DNA-binding NtrC family response regulator
LRVVEIDLPPLRERGEDVPILVEHFLKGLERARGATFNISAAALSCLVAYSWPGNVRELENALEAAAALNRSGVIMPEDLPQKVQAESGDDGRLSEMFVSLPSLEELEKKYVTHVLRITGKNKSMAARILGIDRKTLYRHQSRLKERRARAGK